MITLFIKSSELKLSYKSDECKNAFFKRIDEYGGWPLDENNNSYKYVGYFHTTEEKRECFFSNDYRRTDFQSSIYSVDQYYWWKISDNYKKEIEKQFLISCQNKLTKFIHQLGE